MSKYFITAVVLKFYYYGWTKHIFSKFMSRKWKSVSESFYKVCMEGD